MMVKGVEKDEKIIYKELSFKIIGVLFDVFNDLGYGYQEKYYQKALEVAFEKSGIRFKSQCPYKICYKGEIIGEYFVDFIIEDKVVLEIKRGNYFSRKNFEQVTAYLKATNLKLAILANFTVAGVKYKRVLNIK